VLGTADGEGGQTFARFLSDWTGGAGHPALHRAYLGQPAGCDRHRLVILYAPTEALGVIVGPRGRRRRRWPPRPCRQRPMPR
jgi:hypothetical protein